MRLLWVDACVLLAGGLLGCLAGAWWVAALVPAVWVAALLLSDDDAPAWPEGDDFDGGEVARD